jgi:hypothetical protein
MPDRDPEWIVRTARLLLTRLGAACLTLEAVADELSMPVDQVRANFATTHDLLTALIIEAYNTSGAALEQADALAEQQGLTPGERLLAAARALRAWAAADLASFSLIYGSPVPGYQAPPETVPPASRTPAALARIAHAALVSGALEPPVRKLLGAPLIRDEAVAVFGQLPPRAVRGTARTRHRAVEQSDRPAQLQRAQPHP